MKKDILSIIAKYDITPIREGSLLRAFCPFHHDTGRPNLTLYTENNSWYCFAGCGGGDVASFISKIEGISYKEAAIRLAGYTIDLEELQEKNDGVDFSDGDVEISIPLNILVSSLARGSIRNNPERLPEIMEALQFFDDHTKESSTTSLLKTMRQKLDSAV